MTPPPFVIFGLPRSRTALIAGTAARAGAIVPLLSEADRATSWRR